MAVAGDDDDDDELVVDTTFGLTSDDFTVASDDDDAGVVDGDSVAFGLEISNFFISLVTSCVPISIFCN